ncbi:hypothetical protein HALA3H3_30268 [Halomonas sp. A3H3]|nr:conserved hypothetical protein [Halomonas sp. 156]CAD5278939.1 conserved hypothetical protein [Halomonas sp. 113]CAD5280445.1 conserved hypothetical protein [Halomonas sp. 59]CAD5286350.1 conserved hypothetical protein [Halomonas sp. I3]CDG52051.1 hypothetical protein HALA3H3_30268 [Halomonas sp. A3H3]VXB05621.1 conserved hypothetical protein [Halomonas titanicae]
MHSGDLEMVTKEPWKGYPAAAGRVLMRIVMANLHLMISEKN